VTAAASRPVDVASDLLRIPVSRKLLQAEQLRLVSLKVVEHGSRIQLYYLRPLLRVPQPGTCTPAVRAGQSARARADPSLPCPLVQVHLDVGAAGNVVAGRG